MAHHPPLPQRNVPRNDVANVVDAMLLASRVKRVSIASKRQQEVQTASQTLHTYRTRQNVRSRSSCHGCHSRSAH
jgi:4-hydroxy-3-methylbut-2-en-1-yl diphosphate synthase IspG/GcpE